MSHPASEEASSAILRTPTPHETRSRDQIVDAEGSASDGRDPAPCANIRKETARECVVVYARCAPYIPELEPIMSVRTVASKFVELCRQGKNFDVMRTMYAPDIVSVEGDGKETAGQGPVIKKSEDWVSDKTFNGETVAGPFFNGANPDQFVVFFTLDITPNATGKRITLEEVAVYTVKDDKITREQFFYDGAH